MSESNIFTPDSQQQKEVVAKTNSSTLQKYFLFFGNSACLIAILGIIATLLPYMPGQQSTSGLNHLIIGSSTIFLVAIFGSAALLCSHKMRMIRPLGMLWLLLFLLVGCFGAYLSADMFDSLWGDNVWSYTLTFALMLVFFTVLPLIFQSSKRYLFLLLSVLILVPLLAILEAMSRFWISFDWGIMQPFLAGRQTLVGTYSDLGLLAAVTVLIILIALILLPLRRSVQSVLAGTAVFPFLYIALLNPRFVWWCLFLAVSVSVLYVWLRPVVFQKQPAAQISVSAKFICLLFFLLTLGGVSQGTIIATQLQETISTTISDVRPSLSTSVDIVREVYVGEGLFGAGPNHYADAWRLHKPQNSNDGAFWNIDFAAGYSFMLTIFVTYGIVGGLSLFAFHIYFLWFGVRRMVAATAASLMSRFVFVAAFTSAVFLWAMSYLFVSSDTVLLSAALFTGLTFASAFKVSDLGTCSVSLVTNRVRGFLMLIVLTSLIMGAYLFKAAIWNHHSELIFESIVSETKNDMLMGQLADQNIRDLKEFIATSDPEVIRQDELLTVSELALERSRAAVMLDETNPRHHLRLADLYTLLGTIGVTGGYESALDTLELVKIIDPKNPTHHFAAARVHNALADDEAALQALQLATDLKSNYVPAIQFETDIIIANETETERILQFQEELNLQPSNAIRWFQLGQLHASVGATDESIAALLRAIRIDPTYADARYILALQYILDGRRGNALSQLRLVQETNPNNSVIISLLEQIESGELIVPTNELPKLNEVREPIDNTLPTAVPSFDADSTTAL